MIGNAYLDALAAELFHKFSRMEYALKASGFNNGDGPAQANWRNFALAVDDLIATPSAELREAIDYFMEDPPKKQMIENGLIIWENSKPQTDSRADELLIYVRRVRNNLFHGGKFNGHWFEPERSGQLLRYSLKILNACIEKIPKVHQKFYG